MKPKVAKTVFEDSDFTPFEIPSSWSKEKRNKVTKSVDCQTAPSLFEMQEAEVQSGRYTRTTQIQVQEQEKGAKLLDYISDKRRDVAKEVWNDRITNGFVTVDCEVTTETEVALDTDYFIEYVDCRSHRGTQTDSVRQSILTSDAEETKQDVSNLASFLQRVTVHLWPVLEENLNTTAFDALDYTLSSFTDDADNQTTYWREMSVDLEKKKVIYPDWTKARHFPGVILRCTVTRNKERIYDIEYEDGFVLNGVREEHIRLLDEPGEASRRGTAKRASTSTSSNNEQTTRSGGEGITLTGLSLIPRLQEGVRVHAKVAASRGGGFKYMPGRVVKIGKNLFDVECEGNRIETGLSANDLLIGLLEGQRVEARKPNKVQLQCTAVSWNATGSMIGVTYGRNDISGWCNDPGALCIWNLFSKTFNGSNPELVLDHASCLMSVAFHPVIPSLVAVGSFNGEVILWDLTLPEHALYSSPIIEYSHKEAVTQLTWIQTAAADGWQLMSIGADGKVLFWSMSNRFVCPVRGFLLSRGGGSGRNKDTASTSSRRQYPMSYGISAAAFSSTANISTRPTWLILGQEGGSLVRTHVQRLTTPSTVITPETLRSMPQVDDLYPSLRTLEDGFTFQAHIGAVTAIDWSPFNRNLFLTCGADGLIQLCHVLVQQPLRRFEPAASQQQNQEAKGSNSSDGSIGMIAITSVRFSMIRPCVFAVSTSDGRVFLYDLYQAADSSKRSILPVQVLEVTTDTASTAKPSSSNKKRVCLTGLAFNSQRKDLLAAVDWKGRVHVWRLSSSLVTRRRDEMNVWERLGRIRGDDSDVGQQEEEKKG